jgi:hypothetical protein
MKTVKLLVLGASVLAALTVATAASAGGAGSPVYVSESDVEQSIQRTPWAITNNAFATCGGQGLGHTGGFGTIGDTYKRFFCKESTADYPPHVRTFYVSTVRVDRGHWKGIISGVKVLS